MNVSRTLCAAVAGIAVVSAMGIGLSPVPSKAQGPGAVLNISVQPNPGWGNSCTYNIYVSAGGRPIKNVPVVHWFSGRHSLETIRYTAYTNVQGRATFIDAIPRGWAPTGTWVNMNASCPTLGIQQNWRVKQ